MGELHDGNDIFKTDLHPRTTSPAMWATPIGEVVGDRTNYTASTGHPRSMDLPVPLGARPHIRHTHQPSQDQASRGDCKSAINGSREFNRDDKYLLE
jgi:hypothetical protein